MNNKHMENLFKNVLDCCFEVHTHLGAGLLEQIYKEALMIELDARGISYKSEVPIQLNYKSTPLPTEYRIDILIDDCIIIELKAVNQLNDVHMAQILTYMKISNISLGLLVNFNTKRLKEGVKRVVLDY